MLVAGSEKTIGILCNDLRDSGIPCDIAAPDSVCEPGRVLLMTGSLTGIGSHIPGKSTGRRKWQRFRRVAIRDI